MLRVLLVAAFLLCMGTELQGSEAQSPDSQIQGSGVLEPDETPNELDNDKAWRVGVWYCYSRYVGAYGWGSYYGYSVYPRQAQINALQICQRNHYYDPYGCVVTGCQRY